MGIKRSELKPVLLVRDSQLKIIKEYREEVKKLEEAQKGVGSDMDVVRFSFKCGELNQMKAMIMAWFGVNPDDDFEEDLKEYND